MHRHHALIGWVAVVVALAGCQGITEFGPTTAVVNAIVDPETGTARWGTGAVRATHDTREDDDEGMAYIDATAEIIGAETHRFTTAEAEPGPVVYPYRREPLRVRVTVRGRTIETTITGPSVYTAELALRPLVRNEPDTLSWTPSGEEGVHACAMLRDDQNELYAGWSDISGLCPAYVWQGNGPDDGAATVLAPASLTPGTYHIMMARAAYSRAEVDDGDLVLEVFIVVERRLPVVVR